MKYATCVVLACGLLLSASTLSGQSASRPTRSTLVGCYALTLGPWQQQYPGGPAAWQTLPGVIGLDTALVASLPGFRRLSPVPSYFFERGRPLGAGWRVGPTDSVEALWSTGFVGTRLMLGVHGDTLTGAATASTDVRSRAPDPTASARAVRVACPVELR